MSSPVKHEDTLDSGYVQPGTEIGFYKVETRLGAGGFGSVYRVLRGGKPYALKLSQSRLSDVTPDDRRHMEDRVNREVSALNSLRHPNIVRVHGFERWPDMDGFQFIVMDYVEGVPLLRWVRAAKPSAYALLVVFKKIAIALQEMHRLEVFHRDLKSSNVLVRGDGEPVIVDFGLARPRSAYTVTRADWLLGTISHFAPEYVEYIDSDEYRSGKGRFVWRPTTDLYALGVVLYEALTGEEPHRGEDEGALLDHIKTVSPGLPSAINRALPGAVDALALKLLAKNPAERHQSGDELAQDIDILLARAETRDGAWSSPLLRVARTEPDGSTAGAPKSKPVPQVDPNAPTHIKGAQQEKAQSVDVPLGSLVAGANPQPAAEKPYTMDALPLPKVAEKQAEYGKQVVLPAVEETAFVPPESESRAAKGAPSASRPGLTTQVRQAAARLEEVQSPSRAPKKWALPGVLGVLVLAALGLVWANQVVQGNKAPKPVDLLAKVQSAEPPAEGSPVGGEPPSAGTVPANPHVAPLPPSDPASAARTDAPPPAQAGSPQHHRAGDNADERAINELARAAYNRPKIPGSGASGPAESTAHPSEPTPFATVRRVDGKAAETGPRKFGIPLGTHIRVRLMSNLDSRTVSDAPVEAKLTRAFYLQGDLKLPTRTMLYGDGSASNGRFNVRFTRLVLPDRTEVPLSGVAIDGEDRKPGLKAGRTITMEQPKGDGTATKVGKATAGVLLGTLPGDTSGQLAQRAGQVVLDSNGNPTSSGSSAALLDSGADFDLFVKEAF